MWHYLTLCFPLNNFSSNHSTTFYVVDFGDETPLDTLQHPPPAQVCHDYITTSCLEPGFQFEFSIKAINLCDNSEATIAPIRVFIAPKPEFVMGKGCVDQPATFFNNSKTGFNTSCSGESVFFWEFGDGTDTTTITTDPVDHIYSAPGLYLVKLTSTNNCASTFDTLEVCIAAEPIPNFISTTNSGCVPFATALTDFSTTTNSCETTRVWSVLYNGSPCQPETGKFEFLPGSSPQSLNPQIQFIDPGNYQIVLTISNSCGDFISTQDIVAQAKPQLSLATIDQICRADSIHSYRWLFGLLATNKCLFMDIYGRYSSNLKYARPGFYNLRECWTI